MSSSTNPRHEVRPGNVGDMNAMLADIDEHIALMRKEESFERREGRGAEFDADWKATWDERRELTARIAQATPVARDEMLRVARETLLRASSDARTMANMQFGGDVELHRKADALSAAADLMLCSCEWEEVGGPESGPELSMSEANEACPFHGREADPESWEQGEQFERGYILSNMERYDLLSLPSMNDDYAVALVNAVAPHMDDDDGHGFDRAIGYVADMLKRESKHEGTIQ